MRKAWEILKALGWAVSHMADAEMEYIRSQRTCPKCGHTRQPRGVGPL